MERLAAWLEKTIDKYQRSALIIVLSWMGITACLWALNFPINLILGLWDMVLIFFIIMKVIQLGKYFIQRVI